MSEKEIQVEEAQTYQTGPESVRIEEFSLSGDQVVNKIKNLLREGSVRRITLKTEDGKMLFEVPLTLGVTGFVATALIAPPLAIIGTLAAVITKIQLTVERVEVTEG